MLTGEVTRGGRQIMGGHRGQRQRAVLLLMTGTGVLRGMLEPQDGGAHDAAAGQHVLDPRFEGAQVLADDDGVGKLGLQGQDAHQCVMVEVEVGAGRG